MVVKYRLRLYIFTLVILLGFAALAQRLWNLTIERHEEFVNKIPGTKELDARIPGTRGEIRDRNGIVLVRNIPSYEVTVNLKMLVDEYARELRAKNKNKKIVSAQFTTGDILDVPAFIAKLRDPANPVSVYLWSKAHQTQKALQDPASTPKVLETALMNDLNAVLQAGPQAGPLYEEQRFSAVKLSGEVETLRAKSPERSLLIKFNRLLLEDAYPQDIAKLQRGDLPTVDFAYTDKGVPRTRKETDIVKIVQEVVISNLMRMGLATPFSAKDLQIHYRTTRGVIPWIYRQNLTFEEFSQFAEHRLGLAGVNVDARPVRQYVYNSLLCHVLGYVAPPDIQKTTEAERKDWDSFYVPDDYGVAGVEKSFDNELRGKPGVNRLLQDEKGHIIPKDFTDEPPPRGKPEVERLLLGPDKGKPSRGHDIYLTIDARIQYITEMALRESHPPIGRGAVVVLEPYTGEVLAMASVPDFNPNKFIPKISEKDFNTYNQNPCVPLLNRAVRSYAPGSTYKVMISFAGIMAGIEKEHFNCPGGITYGNKYMKCWIAEHGGAHGMLDLTGGLKNSCNCFFYQYGNKAGIANIEKAGHMFGMGQRTGIELEEEDPGILPTPKWLKIHRPKEPPWSHGTTANTSIGQGFVLATPLQMAGVAAAVGNGGTPYKPHLLLKVMDGKDLVREKAPEARANFAQYGLTPAKLELVRKGMWEVVNADGGTARAARIPGVELAGKTGTAQAWRPDENNPKVSIKDNHTLFICFAPYVHPKYAVCVLVEGGKSGGGCAAPIGRRIVEQSLELDQGKTVDIQPLADVTGNFNHIEQVSFEGIPPIVLKPEEEQDANSVNDDNAKPDKIITPPAVPVAIPVQEAADEEGSRGIKNNQQPPRKPGAFKAPAPSTDSTDGRHLFGH